MNIEIAPKKYEAALNWYDAIIYCQFLEIDRKKDWRLPTHAELLVMYINKTKCGECTFQYLSEVEKNNFYRADRYWTSDEHNTRALNVNFEWGNPIIENKDIICYIRPVRDI